MQKHQDSTQMPLLELVDTQRVEQVHRAHDSPAQHGIGTQGDRWRSTFSGSLVNGQVSATFVGQFLITGQGPGITCCHRWLLT
jgi:hypothetical protein